MIFPADYKERLLKEEKSRHYKSILDEQIREKDLYNLQNKHNKRSNRTQTQPLELYQYKMQVPSLVKQLPHQSTFLPSINLNNNIIDHNYKYYPSSHSKKYFSNLNRKKYAFQNHNDEESDLHLQKCLDECDELIHGISNNFINLNHHLRHQSQRKNIFDKMKQRNRHFSEFQNFNDYESRLSRGYDTHIPITNLKKSQMLPTNDVGRNQMMNYNMFKSKEKEILHMSTPCDKKQYKTIQGDDQEVNYQSGQKTKRKKINEILGDKIKTTSNKKNPGSNLDSIYSNQFINASLPRQIQNKYNESIQKMKKQAKRVTEQIKAHQQTLKKDTKIIEYLRKAKNRGNILFKKIQIFKKQREELQSSNNQPTQNGKKSKQPSSNSEYANSQKSFGSTKELPDQTTNKGMNFQSNINQKTDSKQKKNSSQQQHQSNSQLSQRKS